MGVGEQNGVKPRYARCEQLLAQIRRRIDKHLSFRAIGAALLDKERAAPAAVFRNGRIAGPPSLANARDPAGGPAAKDREGEAHAASAPAGSGILEKRRNALAAVAFASASSDTPLTSARTRAVSLTKAGSLRLPR